MAAAWESVVLDGTVVEIQVDTGTDATVIPPSISESLEDLL